MKRGLIYLFLVFLCFFGCSNYPTTSWKNPGLLIDFSHQSSLTAQVKRISSPHNERARFYPELYLNDNTQWAKSYGGNDIDRALSIQQTRDGGYIVGGSTWSFKDSLGDILVLKLTPSLDIKWQKVYGGDGTERLNSIQETRDKGYIIAGYTQAFGDPLGDALILKVSSKGNLGTECEGLIEVPELKVRDTLESAWEPEIVPSFINLVSQDTNVEPKNVDIIPQDICGHFVQPPINLSLEREINKSLFRKEAFHTVIWGPNPVNNQFVISEYRVYRKELVTREDYSLIGTVTGNTFEYTDRYLPVNKRYYYALTSVDLEGYESSLSEPLENSIRD
ncbi:MAG: hypothetical protein WBF32_13595 [Candidatus Aminicenantaceae bacterium]